jgi:copper resistance protein D
MDAVPLLQAGSAFLLNAGFMWLVGTWFARYWLRSGGAGHAAREREIRRLDLLASGLCVAASAVALLAATAVMGDVGLRQACPMVWMMLTSTDYGHAGAVTIAAMVALLLVRRAGRAGAISDAGAGLALALFAVTRASMGHAGEDGLLSAALAAEAIHYAAAGLWTGAVLVSAWFTLDQSRIATAAIGAYDGYLERMSQAAMAAVLAIAATGVYSAWHRVGTAGHLLHTFYGLTLLVKVALVLAAVALGGYNKWVGLPAAGRAHSGLRLVRTVLRIESVVLLGVLLAASVLTTRQPPAAM